MTKTIIALLGLPGSGKSEVKNHLTSKHGWPNVYFGEVTFDEVKRLGLEINEQNERIAREKLRAEFGMLHYANEMIKKINALENGIILVESLYGWEEYLRFKEEYGDKFYTIAVYASPSIRYARLSNRPIRPLSAEDAKSRDYAQIENLKQAGPIAMADFTAINESTLEDLILQVDMIIKKIMLIRE